ncbi:MAG: hypothetical protein OEY55_04805 [Acidimicrobiia bacterium]|nr:hypothetical protein [Acidimicrobiia bacterium]MDH5421103.1 hypothetical protein [Acidimicrobiia bacterium]MDH5503023.1 hypothetical protein [Acidimicrobiia bacterium]
MIRGAVVAALLLIACSGGSYRVVGTVIDFDGNLLSVNSFTVRADGNDYLFHPAAEIDSEFPLPHLRDHITSGDPVVVAYVVEGDRLVALSIGDG